LSAVPLPSGAQQGMQEMLQKTFTARCQLYREALIARLRRECPLTGALRMLDTLLFATQQPAGVQDLSTELVLREVSTEKDAINAIDRAHKQCHGREIKQQLQVVAERGVQDVLEAKLQQAGIAPPNMSDKIEHFRQHLVTAVPLLQRQSRMTPSEFRSSGAALSPAQLKLYRRLLLYDLAQFVTTVSSPGASREPVLVYAAPESQDLLHWRAIVCG
jgi:hypothetical protein